MKKRWEKGGKKSEKRGSVRSTILDRLQYVDPEVPSTKASPQQQEEQVRNTTINAGEARKLN